MTATLDLREAMRVDVPEGRVGAVVVERFEVPAFSIEMVQAAFHGRDTQPGMYTRLMRNGWLWMSDTDAEQRDHFVPAGEMHRRGGRVLVGGLGLGMIVRAALLWTPVEHVDVIELDPDVIALCGPHYQALAESVGKTLTIHESDVFEWPIPAGERWTVAYFDVWPTLCEDNLPEMARLGRRFNRRHADVTLHWGRDLLLARKRQTADAWWRK